MNRMTQILLTCASLFLSTRAFAGDPYDYAERWRSWTIAAREAYLDGVTDGIAEAFFYTMFNVAQDKWSKKPEPTEVAKVRERLFVRDTRSRLCGVITDLYKDPANGFICTLDMLFLARDKIEGKDITQTVMDARKKAVETHRMNEK